jgi:hypothetical protein
VTFCGVTPSVTLTTKLQLEQPDWVIGKPAVIEIGSDSWAGPDRVLLDSVAWPFVEKTADTPAGKPVIDAVRVPE